ncbi:hypothetical protein EI77_03337 [Prosthecobacter fusiformis]|uniref:Uncharacterized protein n=2 Tax=Prosthecobacter fusiformis TaxID=48464 RepID=A0A4R7RR06_9BACT|nr:hypothetical protein EI77_03337 [Prosthecobacter fusiformis]
MKAFRKLSFHSLALQRSRTRWSAELPLPSVKKAGQIAGGRVEIFSNTYFTLLQSVIDGVLNKATVSPCRVIATQSKILGFTKRRLETLIRASTRTKKSGWTLLPATN